MSTTSPYPRDQGRGALSSGVIAARQSSSAGLRRILPEAAGIVVEIGAGSGANLSLYDAQKVERVIRVGSPGRRRREGDGRSASRDLYDGGLPPLFPLEVIDDRSDAISLASASADTVVSTHALSSVVCLATALAEVRRVLRPMGRLLFIEHGRAQGRRMARWQDRLDPIWSGLMGGSHINRNISRMIENAGFRIEYLDTFRQSSLPGVFGLQVVGIARLR